jgi:uncharacterized protein (TIGR00290 family)
MNAFVCWSGGKDSTISLYLAMKNRNIKIKYLLNMVSEDGIFSRSHGINSTLLNLQTQAIGIPIVQRRATWENYESEFKKIVTELKNKDIQAGVFGDIDLQEHRDWVERVCKDIGIKPILPLWKKDREELMNEFISSGFKAIVVATNADFLGKEWLGREVDNKFIDDLKKLGDIDLCGEKGEYHTFVFGGPIFRKPVEFISGEKVLKEEHWLLELSPKIVDNNY